MQILSQDITFLVKRARVLRAEMTKAVSNNTNFISGPDRIRIDSYLKALKDFKGWIVSQPFMDLPKTSPKQYDLGPSPIVPEMENMDSMVILELMKTAEEEVALSQSGQMTSGLIEQDADRWDKNILKVEKFLTEYVDSNSPLDRPDSAFVNPVVGV